MESVMGRIRPFSALERLGSGVAETILIIEKDTTIKAINQDNGVAMKVKGISVKRAYWDWEGVDFYSLRDLSRTKKLTISIRIGARVKTVSLPNEMLTNLGRYLSNGGKKFSLKGIDCVAFAHIANGVPFVRGKINPNDWSLKRFGYDLWSGETVALVNSGVSGGLEIRHMAIYLGEGLYISKFGDMGNLVVTELEDMKRCFEAGQVYIMEPRR